PPSSPPHYTHSVTAPSHCTFFCSSLRSSPTSTLFPYTTLFRSSTGPLSAGVTTSKFCVTVSTMICTSPREVSALPRTISTLSTRSEEHTSELQSRENLVCRLLLEKKKLATQKNAAA